MRRVAVCLALGLLIPSVAEARFDWRHMLDCMSRGAGGWVAEDARRDQVAVFGYNRVRDGGIFVWRGPMALRTLTHELLHRATRGRPEGYERAMRALTGAVQIDEGLTAYFTDRALERAGVTSFAVEPPTRGRPFSELRGWARDLRQTARRAIASYDVQVDTKSVALLSERCFARVYQKTAERPWVKPQGQVSYAADQERVRELVALVGEAPLRSAYFTGDVQALRTALQQARARDARRFPSWVDLRP
jgi:hypothetical protein